MVKCIVTWEKTLSMVLASDPAAAPRLLVLLVLAFHLAVAAIITNDNAIMNYALPLFSRCACGHRYRVMLHAPSFVPLFRAP